MPAASLRIPELPQGRRRRRWAPVVVWVAAALLAAASALAAQPAAKPTTKAADKPAAKPAAKPADKPAAAPAPAPAPAKKAEEKPKVAAPSPIEVGSTELRTADGVLLRATFYPSSKEKDQRKEAVPVVLLHMWKGDRKEYTKLATFLQSKGHAVLVPDLRGHGESNKQILGNGERTLDASRFGADEFARMVEFDMETLKAYLLRKNNEEELNIEKLCLVGAEMGAAVALNWSQHDWSWPILPGKKQGQDVKALILITPPWSFRGLNARQALNDPAVRTQLSIMLIAGRGDARGLSDASRMHAILQRYHPEPLESERREKQDLFFRRPDTTLQGTKMFDVGGLNFEEPIAEFLEYRLVKQNFPWQDRKPK